MAAIAVRPGAMYAAGVDLPFFVSEGMVRSWAESRGFRNLQIQDRDELKGMPFRVPAGASNEWNTLVQALYTGTATTLDAPGSPAWMIEAPSSRPPAVVATSPAASSSSGTPWTAAVTLASTGAGLAGVPGLLLGALLGWLFERKEPR